MNFDEIVYNTLQKILNLLLGVFEVGYEFVMHPDQLAFILEADEKPGPLTYLVACTILFVCVLLVIKWMTKGTNIRVLISPTPKDWQDGLMKFDIKKILTNAMPFIAMVAAHAGAVMLSFKIFGKDVSFPPIFSAGSYFIGTFFLLCTMLSLGFIFILPRQLPRLRREVNSTVIRKTKRWETMLGILPWIVIIKGFHSYFILLSLHSKTSMWLSIAIWILGTFGLAITSLLVMIWFKPVFFPDFPMNNSSILSREGQPEESN